ncbi:MAG: 2-amino-4-hydroxy-6-hydroxymethyldihydropteridine diphosphokinase [Prevotella sp.]|nr:2-amino-4-hydroxy-6-hydroxymethyldihydropteridine diphosphokinase [Prevotella sp.]
MDDTHKHIVYLALGSNMGDRQAHLRRAINEIEKQVGYVVRQSAFHVTEPVGFQSENLFVNAAVCCHTELSPHELLVVTQRIERQLGRRRKSKNGIYHDRVIDIDILLYDDITVNDPDLIIPHPRMYERPFVMIPLNEILEKQTNP